MEKYLVISALGMDHARNCQNADQNRVGLRRNVVDSRMTVSGGEFTVMLMVSGEWNEETRFSGWVGNCATNSRFGRSGTSAYAPRPENAGYPVFRL